MDELYLDNIDEFVNDHNKIVTYKWLSLTLGVHVNTAKQMLFHYLDHKRKESSAQLHATYLVSGKCVDKGLTSHKVSIVREEQLEDVKAKMSLIVSVHIYSVQKALLKDSGPLYSVDYDAVKDNLKSCSRYSAIRCASAVPMSSLELQQRGKRIELLHQNLKTKSAVNGNGSLTSKPSAKPPKGIMGMFANKSTPKNQDSGKETKSEQKEDSPAVDAPKSKPAAKVNPMMNFFGNQTAKKPEKTMKEEEAAPSSSTAEQQRQSPQPEEKPDAAAAESHKNTKKDSRSKNKRIEDSDSEEEKMEKKKRRRIKLPEPDSSDEDVIPDSPPQMETREASPSPKKEVEAVKQSYQMNSEGKIRKRRRVLKSRTFVDEEGCIVTEKGYESESYSETEDDFQPTKQAPRDPVKAKAPSSSKEDEKKSQKKSSANANKGTKQASIMGFFQKK
ncbi:LOW QUALITY PROTEIN: DNA polymerase delta subunit 3-like [Stegastes partitus]|uniref:DNA polymerase delta subunit 3 n=1 Tax=Stegastes partitus TaxID=144197 RepID=A0A9Y4TVU8_9TELE|nr:PREDICTED: LOW QUALITY PROTEIN: DNA polymerase delta subunit 3-like [Stegastes partitus]XP_008300758.1 PREDICTED: LOW QUALITY PROTEIN: DNA polymerase delta subunit 3-like [Stegastes partitus]